MEIIPLTAPKLNLPLTITPVVEDEIDKPIKRQPDLTFHCMCCKEIFEHPKTLIDHMNKMHADLPGDQNEEATTSKVNITNGFVNENRIYVGNYNHEFDNGNDDEDCIDGDEDDYEEDDDDDDDDEDDIYNSSIIEPICEITDLSEEEIQNFNIKQAENNFVEFHQEPAIKEEYSDVEMDTDGSSRDINQIWPPETSMDDDYENELEIDLENEDNDKESYSSNSNKASSPSQFINFRTRRGRRSLEYQKQAELRRGDPSSKIFQCSQCEDSFPNAGDLAKHVRSHITNKPYQCSICEKSFTHIGSLSTHIRIHSGEKPYKCEICTKSFTQSSSLLVHMRSHSVKKPHQCNLCDKGFINSSSLVLHLKAHAEGEPFACSVCDKSFKNSGLLSEHMLLHQTDTGVYKCAICRDIFKGSAELVQHMKIHMGEKPFQCSICEKSFTQPGSLNTHIRIHSGEKPYKCDICSKSFTQASSLSVHMKIHTNERGFPCNICGKTYSQQAYLKKHMEGHLQGASTSQPLSCIVCGCLFKNAFALAQHVTQVHTDLLQTLKNLQNLRSE